MASFRRGLLAAVAASTAALAGCNQSPEPVAFHLYNATDEAVDVSVTITETGSTTPTVDRTFTLDATDGRDVELDDGDYDLRIAYGDVEDSREFHAEGGTTFDATLTQEGVEYGRSAP